MADDLTKYARDAYFEVQNNGREYNPHIYSSPAFYAHAVGVYLFRAKEPPPIKTRMSRGYSIRVHNIVYKIVEDAQSLNFERVSQ